MVTVSQYHWIRTHTVHWEGLVMNPEMDVIEGCYGTDWNLFLLHRMAWKNVIKHGEGEGPLGR